MMALAPGAVIGPYRIESELGRGGMGIVWRATDTRIGRPVALKTMTAATDPAAIERFVREARAVARLNHPGIVRVYEADVFEGVRYMALELVAGGSLAQRLRAGPLGWREAAGLVRELAHAVHAAHEAGIVHRDLKPQNVLLEDGRPRLTDFGLARDAAVSVMTATGETLGTPYYMAPEQATADRAAIGPRSDVYALGVILYESLTGARPFDGRTPLEVFRRLLEREPERIAAVRLRAKLPPVPPELEAIAMKAFARERADRYASAAELAQDLERFEAGEPVLARPPRILGRALRRHRRMLAAFALLGLGVLAGSVIAREARSRARASEAREAKRRSDLHLNQGIILEGRGEREAALAEYEAAVAATPASMAPFIRRGWARLRSGRPEGLDDFTRAIDLEPRRARPWIERAAARLATGDLTGARSDCEEALRLEPALPEAWAERSAVKLASRDIEGALADSKRAIEVGRDVARGWFVRAQIEESLGRFGEALGSIDRALALEPRDANALSLRTRVLAHLGDVDRALMDATAAVTLEPWRGIRWTDRAVVHRLRRDWRAAEEDLTRALELPGIPLGAWSERARARLELRKLAEAEADATHGIDAREPEARALRAHIRLALDRVDEAAIDADEALRGGRSPEAFFARARVRALRGDRAAATVDLEQAIDLEPDPARVAVMQRELDLLRGDRVTPR